MKSVLRRRLTWMAVVFFSLAIVFFLLRGWLADKALSRLKRELHDRFAMELTIQQYRFQGISTFCMKGLTLLPANGDTLLQLDTLAIRPSFFSWIQGRPGFGYLELQHATLRISDVKGRNNYRSLLHPKASSAAAVESSTKSTRSYADLLHGVLLQAFSLAPQRSHAVDLRLQLRSDTLNEDISIPELVSNSSEIHATLTDESSRSSWRMQGTFHQRKRQFDIQVFPITPNHQVPLLHELLGVSIRFDTVHAQLEQVERLGENLSLKGSFDVRSLSIHHPRIATDTVFIPSLRWDYSVSVGDRFLQIDSASRFVLDRLPLRPFIRLDQDKGMVYSLSLGFDSVPSTDFFASLPRGMFDEVRDIKASGFLSFRLDFQLDSGNPDSARFECSMKKNGFRLNQTGSAGLTRINGEFVYDVFEKERYIRSISIGPSNPDYVPADQVSVFFRNAVLTSEDGNFFFHNGFNEEAFRKSIIANYKAGRFVRGGSTISMQLVKNVFLTRKKTMARKAEEAIIVWLLESNRLVSKDRMLEVYFNIIELGPGVYGIGEASRFYFDKSPRDLDLPESIFLAGLLPRPKAFRSLFDSTGQLKPYMADYYRVMGNFMIKKNLIDQTQFDALRPAVILKGPARDFLLPRDTVVLPEATEPEDQPILWR